MAASRTAVYGAIAANIAIAATKFVVANITGSSAMLSEGIHSAVDTGNDLLLLVGIKLSQRAPTPEHPFGHGKELYFWSLIVAVLIFGLGGGGSIFEGIQHVRRPEPMRTPMWNYLVLAAATVFEGGSFVVALRTFFREKGELPFWRALVTSKNPTTFTVLAEDSAAIAGLVAATIGVAASQAFNRPALDGAASIVIGLILASVAVLLIRESRGLLIGEGVRPDTIKAIREIAQTNPVVKSTGYPLSMYMGPEEALLTLDVQFKSGTRSEEIATAIACIEQEIRRRYPQIKRIYIEAGLVAPYTPATLESTTHD